MQNKILLVLLFSILSLPQQVLSQARPPSPLCTRDNALEMIRQQVDPSKHLTNTQRITILIRAADVLWPYQQDKAHATFSDAFDLAVETEKENTNLPPPSVPLLLRMQVPDQRHLVIRAVAKRDSTWAKELIQQMMKLETGLAEERPARDSLNNVLAGNRLLQSAMQVLATDFNGALELARVSLNYPASFMLNHFLYRLAEVNQQTADQFYAQALAAYGDKPMREFLYLQAYPFAWRETLNTPVFSFHENIPAGFIPNRSLQRRFVQIMLRRAQQVLEVPLDQNDTYRDPSGAWIPVSVHILQGLIRLEPEVRVSQPDLLPALTAAREKILVSLSVENQKLILQPGREASVTPRKSFDEQIESAQKVPDIYERDELIASLVLGSRKEKLATVIQAIDKISDTELRAYLLDWFYFQRAQTAVMDKQFEQAERLTAKVEGLEQRAYLHTEIAKGLLSKNDTGVHAHELLDEGINEAKKAGPTIFAARALLTASNVYTKIDLSRSIEVLADAIDCINHIDAPNFDSEDQAVEKTPERKGREGQYQGEYLLRYYMPGLDPESAFRELAKIEFDTALSQSNALKDKFQRAMATLSLAEVCLQQTPLPKNRRTMSISTRWGATSSLRWKKYLGHSFRPQPGNWNTIQE